MSALNKEISGEHYFNYEWETCTYMVLYSISVLVINWWKFFVPYYYVSIMIIAVLISKMLVKIWQHADALFSDRYHIYIDVSPLELKWYDLMCQYIFLIFFLLRIPFGPMSVDDLVLILKRIDQICETHYIFS